MLLSFALVLLSALLVTAFWKWQAALHGRAASDERALEGLQKFGAVPPFSLTERDGRQVTLADLKGKVSIVNFIYTNCPDTCPIQSAQMRQLQEDFKHESDLLLVSITVDPKRDTPEVLSKYANGFGADPARWVFLTGEQERIYKLAQEGFRLGAVEIPYEQRPASGATHTHSPRFVLVDRNAQIRGYYTSTDADALKRLRDDLKTLLNSEV